MIRIAICGLLFFQASFAVSEKNTDVKMVYGESGRLDSYDPYTVHEASGRRISDLLFDSLVNLSFGNNYQPGLAKSWKLAKDGISVSFKLRDDVVWHNSTQRFNADDVVTTVRLLKDSRSEVPNRERFSVIKEVVKISSDEINITFDRALGDPLKVLLFRILPNHILSRADFLRRDSSFAKAPIGTGPYAFVEANQHGEVFLTANEKYYGGPPKIKKIVMKSYSDQTVMAQSLMFNSLDLVTFVSPRDLAEISGDRSLSVVPYDALSFTFFAFNTSRGILKDRRIRQAISFAIKRNEMLQAFYQGKGQLISGPFPPTSWAYNIDVPPVQFDLSRAKNLFAEAGLSDRNGNGFLQDKTGAEILIKFAVPLSGESELIKRIVLALQQYMQSAGLKVELQFMDWLVWKRKVLGGHDFDMTIASWSFDDASNILSLFHSSSAVPWGNNFVNFKNKEVDSLLTEANVTSDFDKKRAIYQKLHTVLADEAPYCYLWTLMHHAAHNTKLKGVRVEPFSFFKHIASWKMEDRSHVK